MNNVIYEATDTQMVKIDLCIEYTSTKELVPHPYTKHHIPHFLSLPLEHYLLMNGTCTLGVLIRGCLDFNTNGWMGHWLDDVLL